MPGDLHLKLRAVGAGPPAEVRFRKALKYLLRMCQLQVVDYRQDVDPAEELRKQSNAATQDRRDHHA